MKAGCALSLATFAATAAAYYAWLRGRFDPPGDWIAALIGGFLMMMVAGLLQNAHLAWRDQGVMDRAHQGAPPEDGQTFAASGPIRPLGRPLLSPFSGTECVAYEYDVTRGEPSEGDRGGGNAYAGFHLTPSAVETSIGRIKLQSWPLLDDFRRRRVEDEQAYARAAAYVAATTFEPMGVTKVYGQLKDLLTDDDGFVRKDWRMSEEQVDLASCGLRERLVPVGEVVCAIGPYSAEKGGIVPGAGRGQAPVRLLRGSAAVAYTKLRRRFRSHLTGAAVMATLVNGGLFLLAARYEAYVEPRRRIERAEALAQAARQGDMEALRRALAKGDPDLRREDDTPLMIAAQQGQVEAVRALIAAGAQLELTNPRGGRTALGQALDAEQYETARVLREAGARDLTVSARNGTALPPDGGEAYQACVAWLAAVQREDVASLKALWAGESGNLDGIDFSVWKGARPAEPWFIQGFANETAATLYVGGGDREAPSAFWGYELVRTSGVWKIARENWLQKGVPPAP